MDVIIYPSSNIKMTYGSKRGPWSPCWVKASWLCILIAQNSRVLISYRLTFTYYYHIIFYDPASIFIIQPLSVLVRLEDNICAGAYLAHSWHISNILANPLKVKFLLNIYIHIYMHLIWFFGTNIAHKFQSSPPQRPTTNYFTSN